MKAVTMWGVVTPSGTLLPGTMSYSATVAREHVLETPLASDRQIWFGSSGNARVGWEDLCKRGFRCRKFEVRGVK